MKLKMDQKLVRKLLVASATPDSFVRALEPLTTELAIKLAEFAMTVSVAHPEGQEMILAKNHEAIRNLMARVIASSVIMALAKLSGNSETRKNYDAMAKCLADVLMAVDLSAFGIGDSRKSAASGDTVH